jgi:hypothetical protein
MPRPRLDDERVLCIRPSYEFDIGYFKSLLMAEAQEAIQRADEMEDEHVLRLVGMWVRGATCELSNQLRSTAVEKNCGHPIIDKAMGTPLHQIITCRSCGSAFSYEGLDQFFRRIKVEGLE